MKTDKTDISKDEKCETENWLISFILLFFFSFDTIHWIGFVLDITGNMVVDNTFKF